MSYNHRISQWTIHGGCKLLQATMYKHPPFPRASKTRGKFTADPPVQWTWPRKHRVRQNYTTAMACNNVQGECNNYGICLHGCRHESKLGHGSRRAKLKALGRNTSSILASTSPAIQKNPVQPNYVHAQKHKMPKQIHTDNHENEFELLKKTHWKDSEMMFLQGSESVANSGKEWPTTCSEKGHTSRWAKPFRSSQ